MKRVALWIAHFLCTLGLIVLKLEPKDAASSETKRKLLACRIRLQAMRDER